MIVDDIAQGARQVLGYCDLPTLYDRLTLAIECLSNEGEWNSLIGYLDITVSSGNVITLPRFVEVPLRININSNPSFSRSQLYEFTLNGPRNDMADTAGFSWADKGDVPTSPMSTPDQIKVVIPDSTDNGKGIELWGLDADNKELYDKLTLNFASPPVTTNTYKTVTRVLKDTTTKIVELKENISGDQIAYYYPDETQPSYRQILLSKPAASVRMLYRRKTFKITSGSDFIPLDSQMAILMMLKALEAFRNGDPAEVQKGQAFQQMALDYLKKEQESRNNFDLAQNTELPAILDLNYNNSDSLIVADVYDDAASIFGPVGRAKLFDRITDALELLNNKGQWDGLTGFVDIVTDNQHYVTLPRYVETPIAINICGQPKQMMNKWFQFHLNGPGSETDSCETWHDAGETVVLKALTESNQLIYKPDLSTDNGKIITIQGYDENDKWIRTQVGGEWIDGYQITGDSTGALPNVNAQKVTKIDRIIRDATVGFAQLIGHNTDRTVSARLGYYFPDETEPNYKRVRLPMVSSWVRMAYRKRALKVSALTDPLHLKSKIAVVCMLRAVKGLSDGEFDKATAWESKAAQFLEEEQGSRNPSETFDMQFSGFEESCVVL